jgi:hypothetical protein
MSCRFLLTLKKNFGYFEIFGSKDLFKYFSIPKLKASLLGFSDLYNTSFTFNLEKVKLKLSISKIIMIFSF